jgi:hypothetical protein
MIRLWKNITVRIRTSHKSAQYIPRVPQCLSIVLIGTPHPLSRKRVCPSPRTKWEEVGVSQFGRLEKMPSLWSIPNSMKSTIKIYPLDILSDKSVISHNLVPVPGMCSIGASILKNSWRFNQCCGAEVKLPAGAEITNCGCGFFLFTTDLKKFLWKKVMISEEICM